MGTKHGGGDLFRLGWQSLAQGEGEGRALPLLALHTDLARVHLDDVIDDGQPQAGAFADRFGSKGRLAWSRVCDCSRWTSFSVCWD